LTAAGADKEGIILNNSKLWSKEYVIVTIQNFCIALNYFTLMVIASEFAINKFGASSGLAGLAASIFVIGALVMRLFVGRWIALLGYKKTLSIGFVSMTVMTVAYYAINSLALMFVIRFLHGASFAIAMISTTTIVADIIPPERRGEGMG